MLVSIQEMGKTTGIPETSIRRYIQVFNNVLPEGLKLGRTTKYPAEMAERLKVIHFSYQRGLSTVEVRGKLSDTTTLPPLAPQKTTSLQADVQELTMAIKTLTDAVSTLLPQNHHNTTSATEEVPIPATTENKHNTTTLPPDTEEIEPQHHHSTTTTETDTPGEHTTSEPTLEPVQESDNYNTMELVEPEPETLEEHTNHTTTLPPPTKELAIPAKPYNKAEICKIVIDLKDNKNMGYSAIARELKSKGFIPKNKNNQNFHHSTIIKYYKEAKKKQAGRKG
ncbi:MAG: MerR family transcriptional regulator [Thermodesulfobacteriota bacterium]|nr:MerR family transcriptional regulator [Thermodesulfobacteriota bacterium]